MTPAQVQAALLDLSEGDVAQAYEVLVGIVPAAEAYRHLLEEVVPLSYGHRLRRRIFRKIIKKCLFLMGEQVYGTYVPR